MPAEVLSAAGDERLMHVSRGVGFHHHVHRSAAAPSRRRPEHAGLGSVWGHLPRPAMCDRGSFQAKGYLMDARRPSAGLDPVYALPSFLSADAWQHIVAELHLSPQQARIVALILQGKQDKEIAAELHLNRYTIRTYLRRVFDRVELEDRMALVLRIFALCQDHSRATDGVPLMGDT